MEEKNMEKPIAVISVIALIVLAGIGAWYLTSSPKSYFGAD
jgi:hypothetical protein